MSYEPTNWQTGDIVSSERMNKIEGGISNIDTSPLLLNLHLVPNGYRNACQLDKTSSEILEAINAGRSIILEHAIYPAYIAPEGSTSGEYKWFDRGLAMLRSYSLSVDNDGDNNSVPNSLTLEFLIGTYRGNMDEMPRESSD